jgi:(E)-4-hydroxy-3-methylbut-2-enyl-diphosphate synthase
MASTFPLPRRLTRAVKTGNLVIGGGAPVVVQSMTNTDTRNAAATIEQILKLEAAGCELVRVAVPDMTAVEAIPQIIKHISIPLAADIHFDHRLAIESLKAGCGKVRINPGNIGGRDKVEKIVETAASTGAAIRIGVNSGSLEPEILRKYGNPSSEALVESALNHIKILKELGFSNFIVSVKASDIERTVCSYRLLSQECDFPLHIGVTEAGDQFGGVIKSAAALGILLGEGIGDTIRISLTGDPVKEVEAAYALLRNLKLRNVGIEYISCPTCGRTEVEVETVLSRIKEKLSGIRTPLTIAVMGCAVNGPGEAREADIGIAGGKGEFLLFMKGKSVRKIKENAIVDEFVETVREYIKGLDKSKNY